MPLQYVWLLPLGIIIGAFGTLIGAGGGFILVPTLLLLYPDDNPSIITSISLAVVFFNALSGSWAYARMKRINYRAGITFALAGIPGTAIGAYSTAYIPRRTFDILLGILMIAAAAYLVYRPLSAHQAEAHEDGHADFHYNVPLGIAVSVTVGFLSGVLGLGGGIIHVPALVFLLNFPLHVATATSHFILAILAATGTVTHIATGSFHHGIHRTVFLAIGVVVGAQLGARLSNRFHAGWIIRLLATALALVGVRILMLGWSS